MRRRDLLVGSASALLAGAAGCTDSDGESTDERPEENRVEDAIQRAVGQANAAAAQLAAAADDASAPTELDLDVAELEDQLSDARGELDDAAALSAADDYQEELADAERYVDAVAGLVTATASFVDLGDDVAVFETQFRDEDYDAARDTLGDVETAVGDATAAASDAGDDLAAVDEERLAAYGATTGELETAIDQATSLGTAAELLVAGYGHVLDGVASLDDGRAAFEDGDYGAAADEFDAAADEFADAEGEFGDGQDGTETVLDERLARGECRAGHLEDAAGHFAAAASAADSADPVTANSEYQDGEAAVERVADC